MTDQTDTAFDVVVVGGCGHVGLPLAIAFADRGLRVAIYDVNERAVELVNGGELPFMRGRRAEVLHARSSPTAGSPRPPTAASIGRAEHVVVVIGTPVDEHLNPDPHAVPAALARARAAPSATGSCSCCAAPSTRASPRLVERMLADARRSTSTSRSAPSASPRARRWTELFTLPQIVSGRTHRARRDAGRRRCSARSPRRIVRARARGGRAGQAVHQHLALHQVRRRQPVLHDGQRPRPRLRADPRGARRTTTRAPPTCPAPASRPGRACSRTRCSWRRSTTTTSSLGHSAMLVNEGLPLYLVAPHGEDATTWPT